MSISYFQKGAIVKIDASQLEMKRELDEGIWQLEFSKTGRIVEYTIDQLRGMYVSGKLVFFYDRRLPKIKEQIIPDLSQRTIPMPASVTEENWNSAKLKRLYILAVMDLPTTQNVMEQAIRQVANKIGEDFKVPHWVTVSRWKKTYLRNGKNIYSILVKHLAKGNRTRRYPDEVLRIVEETVEAHYLSLQKKKVSIVLEQAILAVDRENKLRIQNDQLPIPTRRLVETVINAIPAFDKCAAREGRTAAIKKFRSVLKKYITHHALERAEIDHTQLDMFVIDDKTLLPLGRPWITACIDVHTRCILGIYIGFEPPSFLTVSRCLKHAFLPKTNLRSEWQKIDNEWCAHGVMENLVVDNGLEFHSFALEKVALAFGININYSARKTPWYKGKIERFFGTLNRDVAHPTPGTTFSSIFEKQEYDSSKHAVVTLSTLRWVIHKWIADVYHQKPHRGLDKQSPAEVWETSVHVEDIPLPDDPEQLEAMMGATENRVLTHIGIVLDGIRYNSSELSKVKNQHGDHLEVNLRINEGDLGYIYVQLPKQQEYIRVPAIDIDYASGLTKFQHTIIKRYTQKSSEKNIVAEWLRSKGEIHDIIENSFQIKSTKTKSRSKIARYSETVSNTLGDVKESEGTLSVSNLSTITNKSTEVIAPVTISAKRPRFTPVIENRTSLNDI